MNFHYFRVLCSFVLFRSDLASARSFELTLERAGINIRERAHIRHCNSSFVYPLA